MAIMNADDIEPNCMRGGVSLNGWSIKEIVWIVLCILLAIGFWFLACVSAAKIVCLIFSCVWSWKLFMTAWTAITAIIVWFSMDDQSAEKCKHCMEGRRIKK